MTMLQKRNDGNNDRPLQATRLLLIFYSLYPSSLSLTRKGWPQSRLSFRSLRSSYNDGTDTHLIVRSRSKHRPNRIYLIRNFGFAPNIRQACIAHRVSFQHEATRRGSTSGIHAWGSQIRDRRKRPVESGSPDHATLKGVTRAADTGSAAYKPYASMNKQTKKKNRGVGDEILYCQRCVAKSVHMGSANKGVPHRLMLLREKLPLVASPRVLSFFFFLFGKHQRS